MSPNRSFSVFDADSHILEPRAIWDEYLDPEYRTLGKFALWREESEFGPYTVVNGKTLRDASSSKVPRNAVWRPGITWEDIGNLDPNAKHAINEGARDPAVRLQDMDSMGIDRALLFPTIFAEHFQLVEHPDTAYALARAYNDWIADFCKAAPNRLYAAAILPLQNMQFALDELQRISKMGCFRAVFLRPVFMEGRYLNHPYYEPLWSQLTRLQLTAVVHANPGINSPEYSSHGPWIEKVKNRMGGPTSLGHPVAEVLAPWFDNSTFLVAAMFYTLFERYPDLQLVLAHGKASWLHLFLEKVETYVLVGTEWAMPVRPDARDLFFESRVAIGFDADEVTVQRFANVFEHKAVWGSRYPQHDAMDAFEAIKRLESGGVSETVIQRMLSDNGAEMYGIALPMKTEG